jgi:hypothetical protein
MDPSSSQVRLPGCDDCPSAVRGARRCTRRTRAYSFATANVPVFPLVAVHVPSGKRGDAGAVGVTTTPSQSRPVPTKSVPVTVHLPSTVQQFALLEDPVSVESARRSLLRAGGSM